MASYEQEIRDNEKALRESQSHTKPAGMLIGKGGDISSKRVCGVCAFVCSVVMLIFGAFIHNELFLESGKMLLVFAGSCLVGGTVAEQIGNIKKG